MLHTADPNLRNVAIIAHVDHGKTTLVDSMLAYCGSMQLDRSEADCVLDSGSAREGAWNHDHLEELRGDLSASIRVNIPTRPAASTSSTRPGHADFGGEVERVLKMADGVLLLVDAFEGSDAADPLRDGQGARAGSSPHVVVINKCDRPNASA